MTETIKTKDLTKKYKEFMALNNVSINIEKNDVYGLVGRNGAGKTTLFKVLMGLTESTSGDITINESNNLVKERNNIGFMIGQTFFPYLNAYQNIEYYRKLKGIKDKKETVRVLKLVKLYGVKKPFKSFSMGMKQRLGIANALLGAPSIVILDEPINGLDPQGITDIRKMIKEINQKENTTFIISSHILSELDLVATKYGFIDKGILLKEISYEELHQQTSKSIIIEVDNTEKAIKLLETKLNIQGYTKGKNNEIILNEHLDKTDKISKLLVENGLKLYTIRKQETTLEEYFINLVGGSQ